MYGYAQLSKEKQADFDLLYSGLLVEEVERVRAFELPYLVDQTMFDKINSLYQCNHKFNLYEQYEYMSDEEERILKTYAVIYYQKEDSLFNYSNIYQNTAEGITEKIPGHLDDEGKVK